MADFVNYQGKEFKVRYQHVRLLDENGKASPKGGKTLAYISNSRHDNPQPPLIVAESECSVKDTFEKKLGRRIALGRLQKVLSA